MKNRDNKKKHNTKIIIIIFALCLIVIGCVIYKSRNDDIGAMSAVIVKVNNDSIDVMEIEEEYSHPILHNVKYSENGNTRFRQGQEVKIYSSVEMIALINPSSIDEVEKVKITKEKSKVVIPKSVLRFYYSSTNNIDIKVNEITTKNINFTIKDTNNEPFEYSKEYSLYKNGGSKLVNQRVNEFYQIIEGKELKLNYDWTNKCGELGERELFVRNLFI